MPSVSQNPADPVLFARLREDNACTVALDGRRLTLRHQPTVRWLDALADQRLQAIMPGMLDEDDLHFYVARLTDPRCRFDLKDSRRITDTVIREVTGLDWWAAVRLANALGRSWFLADGAALMRGVNLLAVPVRRTLEVTYAFAAETCNNERDRAILDADLFRPPEGYEPVWNAVAQAASFAAFRSATGRVTRSGTPG